MRITDNANDFCWRLVDAANKQTLADWVFSCGITGPKMTGQIFIDDDNPLPTIAIAFGKGAAPLQRDAQSLKIMGETMKIAAKARWLRGSSASLASAPVFARIAHHRQS